jgi:hypothetical protein
MKWKKFLYFTVQQFCKFQSCLKSRFDSKSTKLRYHLSPHVTFTAVAFWLNIKFRVTSLPSPPPPSLYYVFYVFHVMPTVSCSLTSLKIITVYSGSDTWSSRHLLFSRNFPFWAIISWRIALIFARSRMLKCEGMQRSYKFCEEQIAYIPLVRHGQQWIQRLQLFYGCSIKVLIEPLPSKDGVIQVQTEGRDLWSSLWDGFRYHNAHTEIHKH